jgi:hypothetical protein
MYNEFPNPTSTLAVMVIDEGLTEAAGFFTFGATAGLGAGAGAIAVFCAGAGAMDFAVGVDGFTVLVVFFMVWL